MTSTEYQTGKENDTPGEKDDSPNKENGVFDGESGALRDFYAGKIPVTPDATKEVFDLATQMRLENEESNRTLRVRIEVLKQMEVFMQFVKVMLPIALLLLAWHNFAPPQWGWLDTSQTDWLKRVIYGAFLLGSTSIAIRGILPKFLSNDD